MKKITPLILMVLSGLIFSCSSQTEKKADTSQLQTIGEVKRLSEAIDELIAEDAQVEILAKGFTWAEGPVWVPKINAVLYTDVPQNTIYQWSPTSGNEVFINPSGYTGYAPASREAGANGLALDADGSLIMCQHGDRRVAKFTGSLSDPSPLFETIADRYQGKRFNSPNDLAIHSNGDIYFTDPPYGLANQDEDSLKEISFNGVYKVSKSGEVLLLDSTLTRPNGIAFSPDEKTLYVANSDPEMAVWYAYDVTLDGVDNKRLFFDATSMVPTGAGLPDGLKVNQEGILFATGPGGVLVLQPDGTHLGTILTELATANCAFGPEEKSLYMTTDDYLTRISLK